MTLATAHPVYSCLLRERKHLLLLTKYHLITVYQLFNDQLLMVMNIHAVNCSLGLMFTAGSCG
jgi:endonuclease/exonuclease/phosphatase (EEP) superfamily protein YafD